MRQMTREEAKELFEDNFTVINTHGHYTKEEEGQAQELAISALSENKGEWIDNGNGSYACSNCKTEWTTSQIEKMCFCPTCGNQKVRGDKAE